MPSRAPSRTASRQDSRYHEHSCWLRYQEFFPGGLQLTSANAPEEQSWPWRGTTVHLDRFTRPEAPVKMIALHGAGTYGRMLAPYGRLPSLSGVDFLAPDLPGFGLTDSPHAVNFGGWLRCVFDLIAAERRADRRPIVLFGVGAGGLLAYEVAARAGGAVSGVIVTCLADAREDDVRRRIAARPEFAEWGASLSLVPPPIRSAVSVPLRLVTNVAAMSNHAQFARLAWSDPLGGGRWVPLSFVRSFLRGIPVVAPERYRGPPILLAHPEEDNWTPPLLSRRFFDRIQGPTRFALLNGAGHVTVEESGLAELDRSIRDFLDEWGLQ